MRTTALVIDGVAIFEDEQRADAALP